MVVRKPGVQKPHCRPWHSMNACCTGPIESIAPSPSTVVTSCAWAVTANIRHDRIGWPSTSTVHAPQTPCSQPTWVPVSRRSWRRKSDSSRRAGAFAWRGTPLTTTVRSSSSSTLPSVGVGDGLGHAAGPSLADGSSLQGNGSGAAVREGEAGQLDGEHRAVGRRGVDVAVGLDGAVDEVGRRPTSRRDAGLLADEGRGDVERPGHVGDRHERQPGVGHQPVRRPRTAAATPAMA